MQLKKATLGILLPLSLTLAGCQTTNPYTNQQQTANSSSGALIGAIAGAAIGVASSSKGDRGKGALIGAASGAALGGGIGYYMDQQEAKLRQQLQASGVSVDRVGDQIILNMPNEITFGVDESQLSSRARNALNSVALVAKEFPQTRLNVIGHTDSSGSESYNLRLSQVRASEVGNYLLNSGVMPNRVNTTGAGETQPIASNNTDMGKAQNRRVEIILTPLQG